MTFKLVREQTIDTLGVTYQEFQHESGAKHIHLQSDAADLAFMVSFPTLPMSNDGRAHILEHLSLCGSKKYPTRDPFFAMTRRSLATFMNAMTYADRTVYPFATQNPKDFDHLMSIYMDAAFFPNLDRLDFLQEGWRYEFDEQGQLQYTGVVFNEMKEHAANAHRALWYGVMDALQPKSTYSYDSGGDTLFIPEITHDILKQFHHEHYHPSRATFWTFGSMDPAMIHARIEKDVIAHFHDRFDRLSPAMFDATQISSQPKRKELPIHADMDPQVNHTFQWAWSLGDVRDQSLYNAWQIFEAAVFGDDASPLKSALQQAGFGRISALNGFSSAGRQMQFHLGMEGLTEDQTSQARALIESTLQSIARDGIAHHRLVSIVDQIELQHRELSNRSMPYGLKWLLSMVDSEMNGADPLRQIDINADIAELRVAIEDPQFISRMAQQLLHELPRVEVHGVPDPKDLERRQLIQFEALQNKTKHLSAQEKQRILDDQKALQERQRAPLNTECLPDMDLHDIPVQPRALMDVPFEACRQGPSLSLIPVATNGVEYLKIRMDASRVDESDLPYLNLATDLMLSLGYGSLDYMQADMERSRLSASMSVHMDIHGVNHSERDVQSFLDLTIKGLHNQVPGMVQLLVDHFQNPRFDEKERIRYLIQTSYQKTIQNVSQKADQFARSAATFSLSSAGVYTSCLNPQNALAFFTRLNDQVQTSEGLDALCEQLQQVWLRCTQDQALLFSWVGDPQPSMVKQAQSILNASLSSHPGFTTLSHQDHCIVREPFFEEAKAIIGPGLVNYCHESFMIPDSTHPDHASLKVLSLYLSNRYLHRALREEGGAYGGSASCAGHTFTFSSYRDPRLQGTYMDFQKAIDFVLNEPVTEQDLKEAILGVIQTMDKPLTPKECAMASLAKQTSHVREEDRQRLRQSIVTCKADDLVRVARQYLKGAPSQKAAYVHSGSLDQIASMGFNEVPLMPNAPTTQSSKMKL